LSLQLGVLFDLSLQFAFHRLGQDSDIQLIPSRVRDIVDKFGLNPYPLVLCHYQFVAGQYNVQLSLIVTRKMQGRANFVICLYCKGISFVHLLILGI